MNSYRYFEPYSWLTFDGTLTAGKSYRIVLVANIAARWAGKNLYIYPESTEHSWQRKLDASEVGQVAEIEIAIQNYTAPSSYTQSGRIVFRLPDLAYDASDTSQLLEGYIYEDNGQTVGSLKQTGIDIRRGVIGLTADNVVVKNSGGTPTAMLDQNGKFTTSLIKADELDTNHLIARDTNGYVIATVNVDYDSNEGEWLPTNDGAYRIYHQSSGSQNTAKKLEIKDVTTNGVTTTMRMFFDNGTDIAWELSTDAYLNGFTNSQVTGMVNLSLQGTDFANDNEAETETTASVTSTYAITPTRIIGASRGIYYDRDYYGSRLGEYNRDKYTVNADGTYTKETLTWNQIQL